MSERGRAQPASGGVSKRDEAKAISAVTLTAAERNGELILELGPLNLASHATTGSGGHDHGTAAYEPPAVAIQVPVSGWMHGYSVEIVDGQGTPAPRKLIHHVNVIAVEKRELFSPIMLRIAAVGTETGPVPLPRIIGYEFKKGDSLVVRAMLHNDGAEAFSGLRIRVRFPFTKKTSLLGALSISPFYIDVTPQAGPHAYDLPAGRSEKFWEGRPAVAGRILGLSGHLHKYGVLMRLEDRTENRVVWEARPDTNSAGEVQPLPIKRFVKTFGVGINPKHTYRLSVVYDNPTGATIPDGGMGALGGVFLPEREVKWPTIDPKDPDYRRDLLAVWR
jgi:hypothetical protein